MVSVLTELLTICALIGYSCVVAESPTAAPTNEQVCASLNSSCEACLSHAACMYCYADSKCKAYPAGKVLPDSSDCHDLSNARWGVCWVNFKVLLIVCGVIVILILLGVAITCTYCCFCRKRRASAAERREDINMDAQRREAEARSAERRAEMDRKHSEIRRKYGLFKTSDTPYRNLEEEA